MEYIIRAENNEIIPLDNVNNYFRINSIIPSGLTISAIHINAIRYTDYGQRENLGHNFDWQSHMTGKELPLRTSLQNGVLISIQIDNSSKNDIVINIDLLP